MAAALAVMLSYGIQVTLSASMSMKYRTLYESQVRRRADSPAHHVEHLLIAMDLLDKRRVTPTTVIGHLDLLNLLESGVAVDLSDGKQLTIGVLKPESPWINIPIGLALEGLTDEVEIVAIHRKDEMLLPHPDTHLEAGDKIFAITTPAIKDQLSKHLAPICPTECLIEDAPVMETQQLT